MLKQGKTEDARKIFTQEEVNKLIGARLKRERSKQEKQFSDRFTAERHRYEHQAINNSYCTCSRSEEVS
jgi:hypothetical protein